MNFLVARQQVAGRKGPSRIADHRVRVSTVRGMVSVLPPLPSFSFFLWNLFLEIATKGGRGYPRPLPPRIEGAGVPRHPPPPPFTFIRRCRTPSHVVPQGFFFKFGDPPGGRTIFRPLFSGSPDPRPPWVGPGRTPRVLT